MRRSRRLSRYIHHSLLTTKSTYKRNLILGNFDHESDVHAHYQGKHTSVEQNTSDINTEYHLTYPYFMNEGYVRWDSRYIHFDVVMTVTFMFDVVMTVTFRMMLWWPLHSDWCCDDRYIQNDVEMTVTLILMLRWPLHWYWWFLYYITPCWILDLIHTGSLSCQACMVPLLGRHDWCYYTSTKCAIPDDMAGQQRF
jgi:hypothetical protein